MQSEPLIAEFAQLDSCPLFSQLRDAKREPSARQRRLKENVIEVRWEEASREVIDYASLT